MVMRFVIGLISAGFLMPLNAQNLVPNPSFEKLIHCPTRLGNFAADVQHWDTPTLGSTDYFNGCSTTMGTPENFNGRQLSSDGHGYAGLYLYAPDDYREYMQVKLTGSLRAGEEYEISMMVSRAERSDFAVNQIGILLTAQELKVPVKKVLTRKHWLKGGNTSYTSFEVGNDGYLAETGDWIRLSSKFTARGGERYLILGNFKNNARTRTRQTKRGAKKGAYYYLDLIVLNATQSLPAISENDLLSGVPIVLNTAHSFPNVLFEFDQHHLKESAKKDLDALYTYLERNSGLNISIDGHTDNVGGDSYNLDLSRRRCKAVAEYLTSLGLPRERIRWEGHGGRNPIADNLTKTGRQQNRRVEFILTQGKMEMNK